MINTHLQGDAKAPARGDGVDLGGWKGFGVSGCEHMLFLFLIWNAFSWRS